MEVISVVLADDHIIVRNGIRSLLENEKDIQVIGEASNGWEALAKAKELKPNVLVIDIRMPELNGIEATAKLPDYASDTKALILSMHNDDEYILQAVDCGASGYVLKDAGQQEFIRAIHTVAKGDKYFSGDISGILVNRYLNKQTSFDKKSEKNPSQKLNDVLDEPLTKRQTEVLQMLVAGMSNKEIANKFNKSIRTIETHRQHIMDKMKVHNIVDMIKMAEKYEIS